MTLGGGGVGSVSWVIKLSNSLSTHPTKIGMPSGPTQPPDVGGRSTVGNLMRKPLILLLNDFILLRKSIFGGNEIFLRSATTPSKSAAIEMDTVDAMIATALTVLDGT